MRDRRTGICRFASANLGRGNRHEGTGIGQAIVDYCFHCGIGCSTGRRHFTSKNSQVVLHCLKLDDSSPKLGSRLRVIAGLGQGMRKCTRHLLGSQGSAH